MHGPDQTLVRLRFKASAVCRSLRWADMGDITQEAMDSAMKGEDMQRTPVYAKIPRPRTLEVCENEWTKNAVRPGWKTRGGAE